MVIFKKLLIVFMLGMMGATCYAHSAVESKKPVVKHNIKKRHVSMIRALWNHLKFSLGCGSLGLGIAAIPFSFQAAFTGFAPLYESLFVLLIPPTLMYLGYKVMQNSFDSMRDEYVESYFGITGPSQIKYSG